MYSEDDLLPISALQHLAFCERQWGLIHLEQVWDENRLTAEGRVMHERTHEPETESRGDLRIARGLRLRSLRLGVTGIADIMEFHRLSGTNGGPDHPVTERTEVPLAGVAGLWRPVPIEYKRGRPKIGHCDEVQLCTQAICLEEMLDVIVVSGSIFYGQPRRRYDVPFGQALRAETARLAGRLHELTRLEKTPPGKYEKKCRSCSLVSFCLPKITAGNKSAQRYLRAAIELMGEE